MLLGCRVVVVVVMGGSLLLSLICCQLLLNCWAVVGLLMLLSYMIWFDFSAIKNFRHDI